MKTYHKTYTNVSQYSTSPSDIEYDTDIDAASIPSRAVSVRLDGADAHIWQDGDVLCVAIEGGPECEESHELWRGTRLGDLDGFIYEVESKKVSGA